MTRSARSRQQRHTADSQGGARDAWFISQKAPREHGRSASLVLQVLDCACAHEAFVLDTDNVTTWFGPSAVAHGQREIFDDPNLPPVLPGDALRVVLPLLVIMSTLLFLCLVFLICVLVLRKRRSIALRDNDGPTDMSREEIAEGEGGFDGVESRWLESISEEVQRNYRRAKGACRHESVIIFYK